MAIKINVDILYEIIQTYCSNVREINNFTKKFYYSNSARRKINT